MFKGGKSLYAPQLQFAAHGVQQGVAGPNADVKLFRAADTGLAYIGLHYGYTHRLEVDGGGQVGRIQVESWIINPLSIALGK